MGRDLSRCYIFSKSRKGQIENSPAIHRWAGGESIVLVPSGTTENSIGASNIQPSVTGLRILTGHFIPSSQLLGYSQSVPSGQPFLDEPDPENARKIIRVRIAFR